MFGIGLGSRGHVFRLKLPEKKLSKRMQDTEERSWKTRSHAQALLSNALTAALPATASEKDLQVFASSAEPRSRSVRAA